MRWVPVHVRPPGPSRRFLRLVALTAAAWLSSHPVIAQQTTPPQFKARIDVVTLSVGVIDKGNKPVSGLRQEDFTIVENGKPRPIVSFSEETVAAESPRGPVWRDEFSPDVATNSANPQRLVIIAMTYVTGMYPWAVNKATELAHDIINKLGPEDMAAVVWLQRAQGGQSFTTDRAKLHAAVNRRPAGNPSVTAACAFDTLFDVFADFPEKRKVIIEIRPPGILGGAGMVVPVPRTNCSPSLLPRAVRIQRANVAIYAVDPNGLGEASNMMVTKDQMSTRGYTIADTNVPEQHLDGILDESSRFYLIGYESNWTRLADYRKLEVKVNRADVTVVAPKNWYSTEPSAKDLRNPKKNQLLERAIEAALPNGAIPLRVVAMPFAPTSATGPASVALVVGVTLPETKRGGATKETIVMQARAYDLDGHLRGSTRQSADVTIGPDEADAQVELLLNLALKPDRYQIRVSASSAMLETAASVYADVTVPDFRGEPLSLSGIALAMNPPPAVASNDAVAKLLPLVPTSQREFATGTTAEVLLRVYQEKAAEPVNVRADIRAADGQVVATETRTLPPAEFSAGRGADVRWALPLAILVPGEYLLVVTAERGALVATRSLQFTRR